MDFKTIFKPLMSYTLILFVSISFAQTAPNTMLDETIYQEYQQNGIDSAIQKYKDLKSKNASEYTWDQWALNRVGYHLMQDGDLDSAEKILKLNMQEYPDASNPVDSYAEVTLAKGDKEAAKKYYLQAVAMGEKSNIEDEKTRILSNSKAQLAKIEGKNNQLDFLEGTWQTATTGFQDGKEAGTQNGYDVMDFNQDHTMMTVHHLDSNKQNVGQRILVYNASKDVYDMAYFNPEILSGITTSCMEVKEAGNGQYEMIETYKDDSGVEKKAKHNLIKNQDGSIDWTIYEGDNSNNWKKVVAMNLHKAN